MKDSCGALPIKFRPIATATFADLNQRSKTVYKPGSAKDMQSFEISLRTKQHTLPSVDSGFSGSVATGILNKMGQKWTNNQLAKEGQRRTQYCKRRAEDQAWSPSSRLPINEWPVNHVHKQTPMRCNFPLGRGMGSCLNNFLKYLVTIRLPKKIVPCFCLLFTFNTAEIGRPKN